MASFLMARMVGLVRRVQGLVDSRLDSGGLAEVDILVPAAVVAAP
jgi:hypothetical protein